MKVYDDPLTLAEHDSDIKIKACTKNPCHCAYNLLRFTGPLVLRFRFIALAEYIFWSFGIIKFILGYFENKILLKPVLGAAASNAYSIAGHEHTHLP